MDEPIYDPLEDISLRLAHAALIRYPHFNALHADIKQCQYLSKISGEPKCMSLEGPPGAGKTTLVKEYAKAFPRIETAERTLVPVFYVPTPSPVTVKGMASKMLEKLGDPGFAHGRRRTDSLDSRLINNLKASTELVILDDFHNLIDTETNRILAKVSDWLKALIKEAEVPFLVVGVEGQVEKILKANSQLSRLFAVRETLHPFAWDIRKLSSIKEFACFIEYAEKAIQMPLTKEIRRVELLYRLYYVTGGLVANIMNLLRAAQLMALMRRNSSIELCDLSLAFQKHLAKHVGITTDPFEVKQARFVPPVPLPEGSVISPGASTGSRRRKKREPKVSETLTTR
jgi:Bacterial TniB protein